MRYLAIDFETNGVPRDKWLMPCPTFLTQVSVDAFVPATGEVVHLHDTFFRGAVDLTEWVVEHTPVTLELLDRGVHPHDVATALEDLWQEGDILVAHNAQFDLGMVLPKTAHPTHPFLTAPFVCTKLEPWVRKEAGKTPKLSTLCSILGVAFHEDRAHDATYDTRVLALALKAAHDTGRTWSLRVPALNGQDTRVQVPREPISRPLPRDRVVQFGKHKGHAFGHVRETDPEYCLYALSQASPTGQLESFAAWLRAECCDQHGRLKPRSCRGQGKGSPSEADQQTDREVKPRLTRMQQRVG